MMQPDTAVYLNDVCFTRDGQSVLEHVTFSLEDGGFMAILGPNGGGKTTLLKIMLGLFTPEHGDIRIFGVPPNEARPQIGYVPQFSTIRQEFPATVLDMALMGAAAPKTAHQSGFRRLWGTDTACRKKALAALDELGIADLANCSLHALSGGQRQRLLVARALMGRVENAPFLLLLDEPTASIDPEGKGCFFEVLDHLRGAVTMVIVSHELTMVSPFFDHVALVNKTLTINPGSCPDTDVMRAFIGTHAPNCPVESMLRHGPACGCEAAPGQAAHSEKNA
ncbi:MAG: Vitamin B12 import ATP-binding protein BtuD [Desulfovibrio sp.]